MTTFIPWRDGSIRARANLPRPKPKPKSAKRKDAHDVSDEPRDDHGRWTATGEGGATTLITIMDGGKNKVPAQLRDENGQPIILSARALQNDLATIRPGQEPPAQLQKTLDNFDKVVDKQLSSIVGKSNLDEHGVGSIHDNLQAVADSAVARYADHPELENSDRFYQQWSFSSRALADESGMTQDRVVAGLASMSPGKTAEQNLRETSDLIRIMGQNDGQGPKLDALGDAPLQRYEQEEALYRAKADDESARPADRSKAETTADALKTAVEGIKSGDMQYMNDLPGVVAARFASDYRKEYNQGYPPLADGAPDAYRYDPKAGFGAAKGWGSYGRSVDVLRGYTVDDSGTHHSYFPPDALDIKTRSFYNNIVDPLDEQGSHAVTVDFHAANTALKTIGIDDYTGWEASPTVAGIPIGVRSHVADGMRDLVPFFRDALGDPTISPARVQEILWAEEKRISGGGFSRAGGENQYYDGTPYDPLDVRKKGR